MVEYLLGERHSYYWVISVNGLVTYSQNLPSRQAISKEVEALKKEVETNSSTSNSAYLRLAKPLSSQLLDKKIAEFKPKRIVFVPDGSLHYLPFAALVSPTINRSDTSSNYLVSDYSLVVLPSLTTLAIQRESQNNRLPAPKTLAILADPVFDNNDDPHRCESSALPNNSLAINQKSAIGRKDLAIPEDPTRSPNGELLKYPRLEFTQKEMREILRLPIRGGTFTACGFDANYKTATSPELSQYKIIHFATHGTVNITHPELSGLVLSLFDKTKRQTPEGLLNLNEIYKMRLQADLVVLSACETAIGTELKGEGVVSLTRGFMVAGAKRVVASLWKVQGKRFNH